MSISVVVPVYNEADNIVPLAEELSSVADMLDDLEVLFVDDGSSDRTWERLCESAEKHPWLKAIHYDSNRGSAQRY